MEAEEDKRREIIFVLIMLGVWFVYAILFYGIKKEKQI